jgi:hypothetical protein
MNGLVMVIERADIGTGEVFDRTESTTHGWESPTAAVKHWRSLHSFTAYKNGRVTHNEDTGLEVRAFFEVPAPLTLFDLEHMQEKAAA